MTEAPARRPSATPACIEFELRRSCVGWLLLAATERGVCFVGLGDDPEALVEGLRTELPYASLQPGRRRARAWCESLLAWVEGRSADLELPLDVRASRFQRRVWDALRAIPRGETRSYAEVAAAIGRPGAARAVARACASNPVALLVPCHRVVPRAGGGGGYRWGAERKRALLALEATETVSSRPRGRDGALPGIPRPRAASQS